MDREQEDMQFLGLFGIYLESYKIIFNFRRTFTKITLALILPLSFIFLAHIDVSEFLFHKIIRTENQRDRFQEGSYWYAKLSDVLTFELAAFCLVKFIYFTFFLVFSLLSTSAVVYTVASIYTGRDVTFRRVMSVVPKVWKRLMVTFLCAFLAFFLYNVVAVLTIIVLFIIVLFIIVLFMIILSFPTEYIDKIVLFFSFVIMILYAVGFVYMTVVWQLASVVSVLEDMKGFKAMNKSRNLIKGKMWIAMVIFFKLNLAMIGIQILFEIVVVMRGLIGIQILFEIVVVMRGSFGIAGRLGFGFLCLLMLFKVFLFGLVIQTVIYFVCKSYHHENIDKSLLSDHLEVYLGEYVPLKSMDVQLEQFEV